MTTILISHNRTILEQQVARMTHHSVRPTHLSIWHLLVKSYKKSLLQQLGQLEAGVLAQVTHLSVTNCNISNEELSSLLDCLPCGQLSHVDISSNSQGVTDKTVLTVLARCSNLTSLTMKNNKRLNDDMFRGEIDYWHSL